MATRCLFFDYYYLASIFCLISLVFIKHSNTVELCIWCGISLTANELNVSCSDSGITEDAVRRYLMRKPMTTTELLQKFKSKKTGLTSDQLVNVMTQILKRINPVKQTIKGKMYLSIKSWHHVMCMKEMCGGGCLYVCSTLVMYRICLIMCGK